MSFNPQQDLPDRIQRARRDSQDQQDTQSQQQPQSRQQDRLEQVERDDVTQTGGQQQATQQQSLDRSVSELQRDDVTQSGGQDRRQQTGGQATQTAGGSTTVSDIQRDDVTQSGRQNQQPQQPQTQVSEQQRQTAAEQFERQLAGGEVNPQAGSGGAAEQLATTGQQTQTRFDVELGAEDVQQDFARTPRQAGPSPTPTAIARERPGELVGAQQQAQRVMTLSESGQRELGQAVQERTQELREASVFQPDAERTTRRTELTPSETARQDRQTAIEQNAARGGIGSLTASELAREERQDFTRTLGALGGTPEVSVIAGQRQFRSERQFASEREALQRQSAERFSRQLGFDVPSSAVNINREQRDGETVLVPELDTEEAKAAGRRQQDYFSTFVGVTETFTDDVGVDVPGEGSVVNVAAVESFDNQTNLRADVVPDEFQEFSRDLSQDFTEQIARPAGDVGAFAARVGTNPVDVTGRRGIIINTAAREFAQGDTAEGFAALGGDTPVTNPTPTDRLSSATVRGATQVFNPGAYLTQGANIAEVGAGGAEAALEGDAEFARYQWNLIGQGTRLAEQSTQTAIENPVRTAGMVVGGAATGVGLGAASKRAFLGARGRAATRGMDIQGEVPVENVERPDVRSGEAGGLTRLSTQAAPEGDLAIPPERLPADPADTPAQEIRNIAREFDDPRIRNALDAQAGEDVVFRAVSGRKSEIYEPRSRRPYDPDATFAAPSVARNFLDLEPSGGYGGGFRRPRPIAAGKSLFNAFRGEGVPNIVAIAGRIEPLPDDVSTLRERTEFLQEQRNTGRLFAPRSGDQQTVTGESEVFMSAEGAESTEAMTFRGTRYDPDEIPGTGVVESGQTTRLVEVAKPYQTRIRGERVPMQMFRQDTEDVIPLSQQGSLSADVRRRIGLDDRGQLDLARAFTRDRDGPETRRTTRVERDRGEPTTPYRPGGQPGTPFFPTFVSGATADGTETPTATTSTREPTATDADTPTVSTGGIAPTDGMATIGGIPTTSLTGVPTDPVGDVPTAPTDTPPSEPDTPTTPTGDVPSVPPTDIPTTPTTDTPTTPTTGTPTTPTTPPSTPITDTPDTPRRPEFDDDNEDDEREFTPLFGGARETYEYDFLNPLSGERLETGSVDVSRRPDELVLTDVVEVDDGQ